jgi:hypothetical protein
MDIACLIEPNQKWVERKGVAVLHVVDVDVQPTLVWVWKKSGRCSQWADSAEFLGRDPMA